MNYSSPYSGFTIFVPKIGYYGNVSCVPLSDPKTKVRLSMCNHVSPRLPVLKFRKDRPSSLRQEGELWKSKEEKTRNAWQSLACSLFGIAVSPTRIALSGRVGLKHSTA